MCGNGKRSFFKNHRNCSHPRLMYATDRSQYGSYISHLEIEWTANCMFWIDCLSWSSLNEQFLWYLKTLPFVISMHFLHFGMSNPCSFQMWFTKSTIVVKLSSNMINIDAADIHSECRVKEVISFFWCSVEFDLGSWLHVVCLLHWARPEITWHRSQPVN